MQTPNPIIDYPSPDTRRGRRHRGMWASHLLLMAGMAQLGLMCLAGAFGVWIGAAIIVSSVAIPIWIARRMRKTELRRICLAASVSERDIERLQHHFNLNLFVLCSIAAVHLIWILPQKAYNMEQARLAAESVQAAVRGSKLARECAEFADAHQNRDSSLPGGIQGLGGGTPVCSDGDALE